MWVSIYKPLDDRHSCINNIYCTQMYEYLLLFELVSAEDDSVLILPNLMCFTFEATTI